MKFFINTAAISGLFILAGCAATTTQTTPEVAVVDEAPDGMCEVVDVVKVNGATEAEARTALKQKAARMGADRVHIFLSNPMAGTGHHIEATAFDCTGVWEAS